jgi:hypothetical protein
MPINRPWESPYSLVTAKHAWERFSSFAEMFEVWKKLLVATQPSWKERRKMGLLIEGRYWSAAWIGEHGLRHWDMRIFRRFVGAGGCG